MKLICHSCGKYDEMEDVHSSPTHSFHRCFSCRKMHTVRLQDVRGCVWSRGQRTELNMCSGELEEIRLGRTSTRSWALPQLSISLDDEDYLEEIDEDTR